MINTGLSSLDNLPDCKLEKLYLNDNNLSGEEVKKLCKYKADLVSLRLVQNKILTVKDVEDLLVACPKLKKLDVSSNKCCDTPEKENELFKKIFANKDHEIEVLNSKDKDGQYFEESYSLDEEEEGEIDMFDSMALDPELREKLENGELTMEEL